MVIVTTMRRALALLEALFLLVLLIEVSPHSVHHLFDTDHVEETCPFAASAERAPAVAADTQSSTLGAPDTQPVATTPEVAPATVQRTADAARAPPSRTL